MASARSRVDKEADPQGLFGPGTVGMTGELAAQKHPGCFYGNRTSYRGCFPDTPPLYPGNLETPPFARRPADFLASNTELERRERGVLVFPGGPAHFGLIVSTAAFAAPPGNTRTPKTGGTLTSSRPWYRASPAPSESGEVVKRTPILRGLFSGLIVMRAERLGIEVLW